jgi:hypothetical protein
VRCASAAGENAIAAKYRDKAQRAVGRFVVSLEGYPELHQSFTAHPDIRLLMANAELPVAI